MGLSIFCSNCNCSLVLPKSINASFMICPTCKRRVPYGAEGIIERYVKYGENNPWVIWEAQKLGVVVHSELYKN